MTGKCRALTSSRREQLKAQGRKHAHASLPYPRPHVSGSSRHGSSYLKSRRGRCTSAWSLSCWTGPPGRSRVTRRSTGPPAPLTCGGGQHSENRGQNMYRAQSVGRRRRQPEAPPTHLTAAEEEDKPDICAELEGCSAAWVDKQRPAFNTKPRNNDRAPARANMLDIVSFRLCRRSVLAGDSPALCEVEGKPTRRVAQ